MMEPSTATRISELLESLCLASELDARLELVDPDAESERLAQALNGFLDKLWLKDFQLAAKQEMLEKVIELRTKEVHEILDNVSNGFLIALPDLTILDNYSRSCARIFERGDLKGRKLTELLRMDERAEGHFAMCYEQVFDDVLPIQVSLGQLPSDFTIGAHSYRIEGSPIFTVHGRVAKVFFTITETTELRKAEAENALRLALLEIVRQKDNFQAFLIDTSHAFDAARNNPTEHVLRSLLHTTKGNLGCFGLHDLAALIHKLEDAPRLALKDAQLIEDTLKRFLETHHALLGFAYPEVNHGARAVEIERLMPLLSTLKGTDTALGRRRAIAAFVQTLDWVAAGSLLAPLAGVAARVADRLGKKVRFEVEGGAVLVDPDRVGPVFANLVHLVRNSVDHGLEPPKDRAPKPEQGQLRIKIEDRGSLWRLSVSDDGRGIDAEGLGRAALERGLVDAAQLSSMSLDEKLELLFKEGVSTSESANMISGRGVGCSALHESVLGLGGTISVKTAPGLGTTFVIELPRPTGPAADASLTSDLERTISSHRSPTP